VDSLTLPSLFGKDSALAASFPVAGVTKKSRISYLKMNSYSVCIGVSPSSAYERQRKFD
jgi:hypothetical protein